MPARPPRRDAAPGDPSPPRDDRPAGPPPPHRTAFLLRRLRQRDALLAHERTLVSLLAGYDGPYHQGWEDELAAIRHLLATFDAPLNGRPPLTRRGLPPPTSASPPQAGRIRRADQRHARASERDGCRLPPSGGILSARARPPTRAAAGRQGGARDPTG